MTYKDAETAPWLNVVLLHWEDSNALGRCLDHLAQSDHPRLRILVVENGSSPQHRSSAAEAVLGARDRFAFIHLLQNEQNLGYVGGNNAGLAFLDQQQLAGDICILNPDVAVGPLTLSTMHAERKQDVGLVMCSAVDERGARLYDKFTLHGFHQTGSLSPMPIVETDYAQGACLLVHRDLIIDTLFDHRFFLYWEEVDLSLRLRDAGYRLVSCTTAPVTRTSNNLSRLPTAIYYSVRNAWLLKGKFPGRFTAAGYALYVARLAVVSLKLGRQPKLLLAAWKSIRVALLDARASRFGMRGAHLAAPGKAIPRPAIPEQVSLHPGKV